MNGKLCRWGILGAAGIARKNWQAIRNTGNSKLVAVASRSQERAQQFIDECQSHTPHPEAPEALGSYEELLARDDIDAVYVPLPTGVRREWVIRAAQAGKHVLCEKPCAPNADGVREMLDACKANNVQFMDGVMYMHSRRLDKLRDVIDDGTTVGEIKRITSHFTFRAPDDFLKTNIRAQSALEPLGCLGDLGWYTIRFALWVTNYRMPREVTGRLLAEHGEKGSDSSVPLEFSAEMFFDGGVSANIYNSFLTEHQQLAMISGSKGYVQMNDFVLPFYGNEVSFDSYNSVFALSGCDFNMENHMRRHSVAEYSSSTRDSQETNLFRNFADLVLSGKVDPKWGEIALKTQVVMDACLESARAASRPVAIAET